MDQKHEYFGILKQQQLRGLMTRHLSAILGQERGVISSALKHSGVNKTKLPERHQRGVFFTHVGLTRGALRQEFPGFSNYQQRKSARDSTQ
jgi:hypothetical protein